VVNKPKIAGTNWETAVVRFLMDHGYPRAERRALSGGLDKGDIINATHTWECKAEKSIDLAGGIKETEQERINAGTEFGFLIIKRRQKPAGEAYAVMTLKQLCEILQRIEDVN
jgi:hypothetical protein